MFSGVSFTIQLGNGSKFTPSYEVHNAETLSEIITNTYKLCGEQGATVEKVLVG
jgi:hypothetical protein